MAGQLTHTAVPSDFGSAIRAVKTELRERIGDYRGAFAAAERAVRAEVAEVVARRGRGAPVWPVVEFADLARGAVSDQLRAAIRRRGCAVVRGTFDPALARCWDDELAGYLERNRFDQVYRYRDDGVFGGLTQSRPSIYPIYWSSPQLQARQHPNMVAVRRFLNGFWTHESQGRVWFDPDRDTAYPDRVRRRPPGTTSGGLSPHVDSGSVERWLLPAYQRVFRSVFDGDPAGYDPWDAAHRTEVDEFPSTVMCSVFRTFQGWTALSDMRPDQGVLAVVPIPSAMAYLLLRALQDDVAADDLCGAVNGQSLPVGDRYHAPLLPALTGIPAVSPGDTVWWHADLVHAVAPVTDQRGWGNVMYIPAAPHCAKNAAYAAACGRAFRTGHSPGDFADEDYEVSWPDRPGVDDLTDTGRRQLGLQAW